MWQVEPLEGLSTWRRWDSDGKRSTNPNRIIFRGIKGIIDHWRIATFGGLLFPMLFFFPTFLD